MFNFCILEQKHIEYLANTVMYIRRRLIYQSIVGVRRTCDVNVEVFDKSKISLYIYIYYMHHFLSLFEDPIKVSIINHVVI